MIHFLKRLAQFHKNESGASTVEFAIVFPAFIMILCSAIEVGVINLRQTALEGRLDQAMRVVRINTSTNYTHDQMRNMICENAPMLGDCEANLRLEVVPNSARNYTPLPSTVDCVHQAFGMSEASNEVRNFALGNANELVMVRACLLYDPIIPTSRMALSRTTDQNGKSALVAVSAFTHEPG